MPRRSTSPPLAVGALIAVLAVSVGGGWYAADHLSHPALRPIVAAAPAEPTYDAPAPEDAVTTPETPPTQAAPAVTIPPARSSTQSSGTPAEPEAPEPDTAPAPGTPSRQGTPPSAAPTRRPTVPPRPAPRPPKKTAPTTLAQYVRPPTVTVEEDQLPAEGTAWSDLVALRNRAGASSQERADIEWILDLARLAAAPDAPDGRKATARRALRFNAWWYRTHNSPAQRVIARDPDGVLLTYRKGHGFMVNPVATMGRWRNLNADWDAPALADAIEGMLVTRGDRITGWAALEYYDVPGDPTAVTPGVSGMGQARAATLFSRAWQMTRIPRYAENAARVLRAFTVPVDDGGVLATVRNPGTGETGPWYPERAYPGKDSWTGAALNGFMAALLGLRGAADQLSGAPDAAPATPITTPSGAPADASQPVAPDAGTVNDAAVASEIARTAAERGVASLITFMPLHDSGAWSYYGLRTPGKPWRTYLADLNYHCYHVTLLRGLEPLYPGRGLASVADRWQGYVDQRGATCPER